MKIFDNLKHKPGCLIVLIIDIILLIIVPIQCTSSKSTLKHIRVAISENDFDKAHKLLAKYDDYYNEGKDKKDEVSKEITKAEFLFNAKNGYMDAALDCLKEYSSHDDDYYENDESVFKENEDIFNIVMQENLNDVALKVLAQWKFHRQFQETSSGRYDSKPTDDMVHRYYNEESKKYNECVDRLLKIAILNKDKSLASQCVNLYRPIGKVVTAKKKDQESNEYEITSKLVNTAKEHALKEIQTAKLY